jgi:GxxExxY protein
MTRMSARDSECPARRRLLRADITREIIGAFYEVYNTLGYGFLEAVYSRAMYIELTRRGLHVQREVMIDVYYKGEPVGKYRVDLLVEYGVVVENKATRWLVESDRDQLQNCLRCSSLEVGLLLHFGPRAKFHRMFAPNPT